MEDKRVAGEFAGTVQRLGARSLDASLEVEVAVLTNVKLRLRDPRSGQESGDVYGKVVGVTAGPTATRCASGSPRWTRPIRS